MAEKTESKKLKIKIRRRKPAPETTGASGELLDMLQKLSGWTPQSDEAVLEAANRLAQAAREKITPDMFKERAVSLDRALATCRKLVGHTLSKFNGIGEDHDYVVEAEKDGSMLALSTVHMFKRNRIGEWAVSSRTVYVDPGSVMSDRSIVKGRPGTPCRIAGYTLDSAHAAAAYAELKGIVEAVSKAIPGAPARRRASRRDI